VKKNLFFTFGENSSHMTAQKRHRFLALAANRNLVGLENRRLQKKEKNKKTLGGSFFQASILTTIPPRSRLRRRRLEENRRLKVLM
jgi:hypothetical protein